MADSLRSDLIDPEGFFKVCRIADLKEREGKRFNINDADVAIFKVEGEVFAVSNICPHQHSALIYDGFIDKGCVVCPVHGWMFDLRTGRMPSKAAGLETYPVKILEDWVFVKASAKRFNW